MNLEKFNSLDKDTAGQELLQCCGSAKWASLVAAGRPYATERDLVKKAVAVWYNDCAPADWQEAFSHHPQIGDLKSVTERFAGKEQAAVGSASADTLMQLAKLNQDYHHRFGFIFIVCATGKSAEEMLQLLQQRIQHTAAEEEAIAMGEQMKITILRLKKIMTGADWSALAVSQLTTHVLDTSIGKPGQDICIRLAKPAEGGWQHIAFGITNADGRIPDLLPAERILPAGNYKIIFDTGAYYQQQGIPTFYPAAEITFTIFDESHYHVPLLLNPFGYSTYRGS